MTDEIQGAGAPTPAEGTTTPATEQTQADQASAPEATTDAQTPAPVETKAEPGDEGDEEQRRPSTAQRNKRRLQIIQAEIARLEAENNELRQRTAGGSKDGKPGIDREPTEQDFPNDYLAFERAKTAYEVRQSVRDEINRDRQVAQHRAQAELRAERVEAHEENLAAARERIPDFDKVLATGGKDIVISDEVQAEILSSDKSALLIYHLAQNPERARELNGLTGRELARAIGRLEGRVHLPKPQTQTKAAAPPTQVKGGAAPPVNLHDKSLSMDAYVAERRRQMERR